MAPSAKGAQHTVKVFLHIGWRKTGSTAIQQFLAHNRQALRECFGIHYPSAGSYQAGHHPVAWAMQSPQPRVLQRIGFIASPESTLERMFEEARLDGCGAMIISSEEFSSIDRYDLGRLALGLKGADTTVIAWLRWQDAYIEALYGHKVRSPRLRFKEDIKTFAGRCINGEALDYYRYFSRWAAVFGKDNVKPRLYDRSCFPAGDIRLDLCDVIQVDRNKLLLDAGDSNVSLDPGSVWFLARLNQVPLQRHHHIRVVQALSQRTQDKPRMGSGLLDPGLRSLILRRFAPSNEKFIREFVGDAAMPDGMSDNGRAPSDAMPDPEDSFDEALAYVVPRLLAPEPDVPAKSECQ